MSSAPVARPVDQQGARESALGKVWKDVKWKLQPEAYNVRKVMAKALERAVDSSENLLPCQCYESTSLPVHLMHHILAHQHDSSKAKEWLSELFDEETLDKVAPSRHSH